MTIPILPLDANEPIGHSGWMHRDVLVKLLRALVDSPPQSRGEADEVEAALSDDDDSAAEGVREALDLYEPTDSPAPHLVGFAGLRAAARESLHDLGDHGHCLHDVPLAERP